MLFKVTLGIAIVLGLLLSAVGSLYIGKVEEYGKLEATYAAQREETKKANAEIVSLREQSAAQSVRVTRLQEMKRDDEVKYQQALRRVEQQRRSTLRAAQEYPERFSRIATFNLRRGMRDVCRAGGGTPEQCKISIPKPSAPSASDPVQPDGEDPPRVGGGDSHGQD